MKCLLISSSSSIENGASKSLISIAEKMRKYGLFIQVIIPRHGSIEQELKTKGIKYKVIFFSATFWVIGFLQKDSFAKKVVKRIVNGIAYIRMNSIVKDFDIVHINAITTDLGAKAAIRNNKKLIWHIREYLEEDISMKFVDKEKSCQLIKKADVRIAVSKAVKEHFEKSFGKIDVIYNGVDESFLNEKKQIFCGNKIKILLPGRIDSKKGHLLLLQAIKILTDSWEGGVFSDCNRESYEIDFVGNGDKNYVNELMSYINSNNLNVKILPYANAIKAHYENADIVCIPSAKEAFGRCIAESMLSGCLAVSFYDEKGSAKELLSDDCGVFFDEYTPESLAQTIKDIVLNTDKYKIFAQNGQRKALDCFTASKYAENIFNLYQQTMLVNVI